MDVQPVSRLWRWSAFVAGLVAGLILGIPLGVIGLIVLMQVLTVMISLP